MVAFLNHENHYIMKNRGEQGISVEKSIIINVNENRNLG